MSSKEVVFVGDDVIVVTSGCAINSYTFMSEATSELGCQELTPNRVSLAPTWIIQDLTLRKIAI